MELPEFFYSVGFWIKFVPIFFLFVVVPIWFMDFTNSLNWWKKIIFMIGGAFGLMLALNGKTIGKKHGIPIGRR